jgi:hypothetical protein
MTNLIVAFRNFANAPKKKRPTLKIIRLHLIWLRSTKSSLLWKCLLESFVSHEEKKDVSSRPQFLERATPPCDRIWYNLGIIHPFVVSTTILLLQVPSSSSSSHILLPPSETRSCYYHLPPPPRTCGNSPLLLTLHSAQPNGSTERYSVRSARSPCLLITVDTASQVLKLMKRPAIKTVTGDQLISLDCRRPVTTYQTTAGIYQTTI